MARATHEQVESRNADIRMLYGEKERMRAINAALLTACELAIEALESTRDGAAQTARDYLRDAVDEARSA